MWDSPVHRQAIVNESRLLTCMNVLGILFIIVVEPSVSFPGTELNIFIVDIVLKIEDCLVVGGHVQGNRKRWTGFETAIT